MTSFYVPVLLVFAVAVCNCAKQPGLSVLEGKDIKLDCGIRKPVPHSARLYWLGPVNGSMDNYAIDSSTFNKDYRVNLQRNTGRYDLTISRATYKRNNGLFVCRVKEEGTVRELHSMSVNLTVLIKPGSPRISPLNPTVTQGHPLSLTCASQGGSPDPDIYWIRKSTGEKVQGVLKPGGGRDFPTTSVLRIEPRKEDDGEEFNCHVENRALAQNEKMVANVKLNVNYYPIVRITPSNPVRVIEGQNVDLHCEVDAKPKVQNVRWMRGGAFIQTTNRFQIRSASLDDAGRYICQADNHLGRPGEAEVTVDVLYPPTVSVPIRNEASSGESVSVHCNVSANPAPDFVFWTKVGDESFRQKGETMQLSDVDSTDHGDYVCNAVTVLTRGGNEITLKGNATVHVHVRHAPGKSFILPSQPVAVEGKDVVLQCRAEPPGYPHPQYRWWRDDKVLTMGENFTISKASRAAEGIYHCQPFNSIGNGTVSSATLRVFQPPRIFEGLKPTATHKREITDLKLSCRAQGKPKPVAKWFKNGGEIDAKSAGFYEIQVQYAELDADSGFQVLSTLLFRGPDRIGQKGLRPEDRGNYECSFENDAEQVRSSQLLRIQHPPAVAHKQSEAAFDLGEDAHLSCEMRAFPPPTFSWAFKRAEIAPANAERYAVNNTDLGEDLFVSILTIRSINDEDYGAYTCKATNDEGPSKTILNLQRKGAPLESSNLALVDAGFDYLRLSFDPGFDGGFTREIKYWAQVTTSDVPGGDLIAICAIGSCIVEGLTQNTEYTVRIYAENPLGQSALSAPLITRTTMDPQSIPAPSQVYVEKGSNAVMFAVPDVVHQDSQTLVARLEVMYDDGSEWSKVPSDVPIRDLKGRYDLATTTGDVDVRVQLCAKDSVDLCGPFTSAVHVTDMPSHVLSSGSVNNLMIVIVVVVCIVVLLFVSGLVCCRCRHQRNSKIKKKTQMEVSHRGVVTQQAPPPPYYTVGLENKGLEGSIDRLNEHNKALIYGSQQQYSNYSQNHGPSHNNNPGGNLMDNSYSNSNNGGSVNSQDSLWQLKGNPNQQQQQQIQQQQQQQIQQQQQQQIQHQMQQQHQPDGGRQGVYNPPPQSGYGGYDDYAQYPHEEYDGNAYEPYGAPKPRHIEDDGYDVSGVPNPYMEHNNPHLNPALHNPQMNPSMHPSPMNPDTKPSFDESLESGFSTPNSRNRRIIREIIV